MGLFVIVLDADSPVLVADGRCLRVAEVEFFCRIDQEDDREFKPLLLWIVMMRTASAAETEGVLARKLRPSFVRRESSVRKE